jgi:hypothetical protein
MFFRLVLEGPLKVGLPKQQEVLETGKKVEARKQTIVAPQTLDWY